MRYRCVLLWVTVTTAGTAAAQSPPRLDEPVCPSGELRVATYGDGENVRLLGGLLDDADALVRQEAAIGLGETHNPAALEPLRKAAADAHVGVRCAAVVAAAEFPADRSGDIVMAALASDESREVQAALRSVRRMELTPAGDAVARLLSSQDAAVQAAALVTLAELGRPVDAARLVALLKSPSPGVRQRAAQAAQRATSDPALLAELGRLATEDRSPVRAEALKALGRHDFAKAAPLVETARQSDDPMLRRGAVWACHHGRQTAAIRAYLDDPSSMVRLAAIRAAGELKAADTVDRLFELLFDVPDELSHLAARRSLRQIGNQSVIDGAGQRFVRHAPTYAIATPVVGGGPGPIRSREELAALRKLERNLRACCWLLGKMKSKVAFEERQATFDESIKTLPVVDYASRLLAELVESLGVLGDPRPIDPMIELLRNCGRRGRAKLVAELSMRPGPPYSDEVTCATIVALRDLGATKAVPAMIEVGNVNVQTMRLTRPAAAAARVMPDLVTAENRSAITKYLNGLMTEPGYGLIARFEAAKAAGRLKLDTALPALRKTLDEDRTTLLLMQAAAWAIQEITGRTPPIPEPKINQGDWIIRKIVR